MLAADERESRTELGLGVVQPVGRGLFQCPFGGSLREVREVEDIRVSDDFLGLIGVGWVHVLVEVAGRAGPAPLVQPGHDMMFEHGRDHPSRASRSAYQSRRAGSLTWSSNVQTCPHGSFPTGRREIGSVPGHAAAKARMY